MAKRLLCITAHPDDEAASFGGTLMHYHEHGAETYVICLTSGEAARHRGGAASDSELAAMRRREFGEACRILNVTNAEIYDCPDGQLDRGDFFGIVARLTRRIRTIRPHVVITFGPEGGITSHPDHGMAGVFTTMAFHWAGRTNRFPEQMESELANGLQPWRPNKLYYGTNLITMPDRQPVSNPPVTAKIEVGRFESAKVRAFHAHRSQAPLFPIFEDNLSRQGTAELYHLAATCTPSEMAIEDDLFAGIVAIS